MSRAHGWATSPNRKHIPTHIRRYVERRDQGMCQVKWDARCQGTGTELDHLVSPHDGGTDTAPNLRLACSPCNASRNYATRRRPLSTKRPARPIPGLLPPK